MKIRVINPNSSASMTQHLRRELEAVKGPATELSVVNPIDGPRSIESAFDEAQAIPATLTLVEQAQGEGCDAVVLACFSDPGLDAAREIATIPIVGIEETALHVAALLGHRFTILTTRSRRVPAKLEHVARLGLQGRLASVRPLDMSVLEMDSDPVRAGIRILEVGRTAVEQDGAEVLVLGCAGLAGYTPTLAQTLTVAVVDPSAVSLKMAEVMVDLRLTHSKRGLYAWPTSRQPTV
jgi:allantoin racemase